MPLHIDYRPKTLDEVIGNDAIKTSLKTILARSDKPHAYLFVGPSGTGKTTFARIIASDLKCHPADLQEYNSANTRGIDTIREITENSHYSAMSGKVKVYLLDEVQKLTSDAQGAILKILEDCPSHVYFILCTTDPNKLIPTIRNRCTSFQTTTLLETQIRKLIKWVLDSEQIKDFPDSVIKEIIRVSDGCPRQALVILDSVIDITNEKECLEAVAAVQVADAEAIEVIRGIVNKATWDSLKGKVKILITKSDPEKLRHAILGYLTKILLDKDDDRISDLIDLFSDPTFNSGQAGIVNMIRIATKVK